MSVLASDLNIKLMSTIFNQRIYRTHDFAKMHSCGLFLANANVAVKVQKIDTVRQWFGALTFDVLAHVVLAGVEQAARVFTFNF